MTRLPVLSGPEVVAILVKHGFAVLRQKGSHVRLAHPDGRKITVPVHQGQVWDAACCEKSCATPN